jgi:hypothetical protein
MAKVKQENEKQPSQPPGEASPDDFGVSPKPGSDQPPMEERGMEQTADDTKDKD